VKAQGPIASAASHNDPFVLGPGDAVRADLLGAAHSVAPTRPVHWLPMADLTGLGSPTLPRAHLRPDRFEKTCLGSSEALPPGVAIYDLFLLLVSQPFLCFRRLFGYATACHSYPPAAALRGGWFSTQVTYHLVRQHLSLLFYYIFFSWSRAWLYRTVFYSLLSALLLFCAHACFGCR
jgi:hypothetical protein